MNYQGVDSDINGATQEIVMAKEIKICGGAYGDKGGATLKDEKYKKEIKNKAHEVEKYRVHDKEHKERRSVECVRCWMCFSS